MPPRGTNGQFAPPPPGSRSEQTGEQIPHQGRYPHVPPYLETVNTFAYLLMANGATSWNNPMAFPGYEHLYTGAYSTYRWMLCNPVIRLVRSIRVGIIAANTWEYVPYHDGDIPNDTWINWTKRTFDPLRPSLIWDFMARGHDMGWVGGEPIWEYDNGRFRLDRVKQLLHEQTETLTNPGGSVWGLRNSISPEPGKTGPIDLQAPYKAFHWAYDSEAGYVYGRSWLENLRTTAWKAWLDSAQQLQRLGGKISGTVTIITSPAGTFPGPPGTDGKPTQVSFRDNAVKAIKALAEGAAGIWFPSLGLNPDGKGGMDAMKVMAQLIGKSMTNVDVKDFSGNSAAISSLLEKMKHEEEQFFMGGLRPARVGLEAEHGSRADAGEHTNTGTFNAEADDEAFAGSLQPLVDANLVINFGEKARRQVKIKPTSLVDRKTAILKALLLALINDTETGKEIARTINVDAMLKGLDVAASKKFEPDKVAAPAPAGPKPNPKTPEPQGGRPAQE